MSNSKMLVIPAVLLSAVVLLPGFAHAQKKGGGGGSTGSTSCKGDRAVDAPIQVAVDVQSPGRLHASGYGGSDKSGLIYPTTWTLYDAAGAQVSKFPTATPVWTSSAMLKEVNIEGLVPGATYSVALNSQDWCGNNAVVKKTITMPAAAGEGNVPELSTPTTIQSGLMGYLFTQITFDVTDDTGLRSVTVSIDGTAVSTSTYGDGRGFRWWFDDYPFDDTQSTLEGPIYYISVPDAYKGGSHLVQVVVVDIYGNQSVSSALLGL